MFNWLWKTVIGESAATAFGVATPETPPTEKEAVSPTKGARTASSSSAKKAQKQTKGVNRTRSKKATNAAVSAASFKKSKYKYDGYSGDLSFLYRMDNSVKPNRSAKTSTKSATNKKSVKKISTKKPAVKKTAAPGKTNAKAGAPKKTAAKKTGAQAKFVRPVKVTRTRASNHRPKRNVKT